MKNKTETETKGWFQEEEEKKKNHTFDSRTLSISKNNSKGTTTMTTLVAENLQKRKVHS